MHHSVKRVSRGASTSVITVSRGIGIRLDRYPYAMEVTTNSHPATKCEALDSDK